jgi:uncharacterized membrane protein
MNKGVFKSNIVKDLAKRSVRPGQLWAVLLMLQILFCTAVLFNIQIVRQVLGFLFLTFIPGFLVLRLLRLKLEMTEMVVFAAGFGIAVVMGVGLSLDIIGPIAGIARPLELLPTMITINLMIFLLGLVLWKDHILGDFHKASKRSVVLWAALCVILILSTLGTLLASAPPYNNNLGPLAMLVLIAVLISLTALSRGLASSRSYPLVLLVVALALLFHVSLFSNYIHGRDIFEEYHVFSVTSASSYWNPALPSKLSAMLSVTILPTMFSSTMGINGAWLLKIVYPLIFSLVPLCLYRLYRSEFEAREIAFFSVFYFISNMIFFTEMLELARQMVGELFYALLFLTTFSKNMQGSVKWISFAVFGFGLIVSHYAMAYIFLAFALGMWLVSALRKRKGCLTLPMIVLLAVMTFVWYVYVSSAASFEGLVNMGSYVSNSFVSDFFNPASRGSSVMEATGLGGGLGTFWHGIGRYYYFLTEGLLLVGFFSAIIKKRSLFFKDDYGTMVFLNILLVGACIAVPNFAESFNMTRFYHVALFILAPFCILGWVNLFSFLTRHRVMEKYLVAIMVLVVLVPFFLFQTGAIYETSKEESWSLPLSAYRFSTLKLHWDMSVLAESEVSGVSWLLEFRGPKTEIYADIRSRSIFWYCNVSLSSLHWLALGDRVDNSSYVYLRSFNVRESVVFIQDVSEGSFNVTEIRPSLDTTDLIYSSGLSAIWKTPPP